MVVTFTVYLFQEPTVLKHTGAILQQGPKFTRYDFGIQTLTGIVLGYGNNSAKYHHLGFSYLSISHIS